MSTEHIVLASSIEELEEEPVENTREDNARLDQCSSLRRCETNFILFNQHYLSIDTQRFRKQRQAYELDLAFLDPVPKRVRKISWRLLLAAAFLAGLALLSILPGAMQTGLAVSAFLISGVFFTLLLAIYRSHDRLVFYSQHGRAALVVMFNRNPDPETFAAFRDKLVQSIVNAKQCFSKRSNVLSAELQEHRRLMEEGVLSKKRYQVVKQRILEHHK